MDPPATDGRPVYERFHHMSTCYVSGRYDGRFTEDDLQVGQTFNNAHEETKHRAEVLVQERMRDGLPATVYRPAIVVGDSRTGRTGKYDGPYFMIRWLLRWRRRPPVPVPPVTVSRALEILAEAAGRRPLQVPVPPRLVRAALARAPWLEARVGIPAELFDYLDHPTRYGTARAEQDLAGTGIEVPAFASYADRLVAFVDAHPAGPGAGGPADAL